jgi:hypothetical protein
MLRDGLIALGVILGTAALTIAVLHVVFGLPPG